MQLSCTLPTVYFLIILSSRSGMQYTDKAPVAGEVTCADEVTGRTYAFGKGFATGWGAQHVKPHPPSFL